MSKQADSKTEDLNAWIKRRGALLGQPRESRIVQFQVRESPQGIVFYVLTNEGKIFVSAPGTSQLRKVELHFVSDEKVQAQGSGSS